MGTIATAPVLPGTVVNHKRSRAELQFRAQQPQSLPFMANATTAPDAKVIPAIARIAHCIRTDYPLPG